MRRATAYDDAAMPETHGPRNVPTARGVIAQEMGGDRATKQQPASLHIRDSKVSEGLHQMWRLLGTSRRASEMRARRSVVRVSMDREGD